MHKQGAKSTSVRSLKVVISLTFLVMFLCVSTFAQSNRTDVVVMKNGDRITCEILRVEGGILYVQMDYVDGTVAIDWSKVAKMESARLFVLRTGDGSAHEGHVTTAAPDPGQGVELKVTVDGKKRIEVARADIVTVESSSNKIWRRFNGSIDFGLNYAKGHNSTQYNLGSTLEYPRERWGFNVSLNSNLSYFDGEKTLTHNEIRTRAYRLLRSKRNFVTGGVGFLQSSNSGIKLETDIIGGFGHFFVNSNRAKIAITGGLGFARTQYEAPGVPVNTVQNSIAGMISTEIRYSKFKRTGFVLHASFLPSLNDPGRFYFRMDQKYYVKIFNDITWNISVFGNWDSRPPFALNNSDIGLSSGIGWKFGSR